MKKILAGVLTAAAVLSIGGVGVFAAGPGLRAHHPEASVTAECGHSGCGAVCRYADGDKVCTYADEDGVCGYVDEDGDPTMNGEWNINGSSYAIEGITSPDGRILGKMGHSERYEEGLFQNIDGNKEQNIFANGVNYFRQR